MKQILNVDCTDNVINDVLQKPLSENIVDKLLAFSSDDEDDIALEFHVLLLVESLSSLKMEKRELREYQRSFIKGASFSQQLSR